MNTESEFDHQQDHIVEPENSDLQMLAKPGHSLPSENEK